MIFQTKCQWSRVECSFIPSWFWAHFAREYFSSPWRLVAQLKASCCPLPGSLLLPRLFISAAWIVKIVISPAGNLASREEGETSGLKCKLVWNLLQLPQTSSQSNARSFRGTVSNVNPGVELDTKLLVSVHLSSI